MSEQVCPLAYAGKLFELFQQLRSAKEYYGTGTNV
jgi:light-regulated signal transduction histidine kinase (bacteriophytochrome)